MLHVDRRAQSSVDVQESRSPVQRYLDGARGYAKPDRLPPEVQGGPTIPFGGLAEGMFLSTLRRPGVPMQQIRPALDLLRTRLGVEHVLASKRLYVVGAQLIWEVGTSEGLDDEVTVVPVSVVKGLELDGVVVVEPACIAADETLGLRALYVALTRPTQRLTVVHAAPLPASMA